MSAILERYGTVLRCYDNGGRSMDRYTILPPRWTIDYRSPNGEWDGVGASENPFHPQGFGQCVSAMPGPRLGKRVHWRELPEPVQQLARETFPGYAP